ncbi:hypothetical protein [Candidatus Magnetominusculus xianensis]|uniref:Secreted protein n=1 Tax=Candidatus Magnetominusculus xianensis TaxID=1748249 RepID=A0ABR5SG92_9BACT|nr:hypothetical protein [Candidatus Magnetominusculus xianensis]KWT88348.1 hypothetical protein ASN18_1270 [Candidatus Magnetominusculus xianensis]MBF0405447.1 hypothetical protein [Nitrospirota bacterium]
MKRIAAIIAAVMLLSSPFVLVSCGHKAPPKLKEQGRQKEAPPQKPPEELSPYSEDTERLRTQ